LGTRTRAADRSRSPLPPRTGGLPPPPGQVVVHLRRVRQRLERPADRGQRARDQVGLAARAHAEHHGRPHVKGVTRAPERGRAAARHQVLLQHQHGPQSVLAHLCGGGQAAHAGADDDGVVEDVGGGVGAEARDGVGGRIGGGLGGGGRGGGGPGGGRGGRGVWGGREGAGAAAAAGQRAATRGGGVGGGGDRRAAELSAAVCCLRAAARRRHGMVNAAEHRCVIED